MGYFVNSDEEVDAVMKQAESAGATITRPAQEAFGVVITDTFKTLTDIYGKLVIIHRGKLKNKLS